MVRAPHITTDKETSHSEISLPAPKETKGEVVYDLLLYTGVGYFANFVLSVIGGHYFLKGSGQGMYNKTREWIHSKTSPIFNEKYSKFITDEATRILSLGAGGHLVMIPIKWMEDNKKKFVYAINRKFFPNEYGAEVDISKPASQMTDEELPELHETPAKMSWTKTIVRRTAIFFGIGFALAPFAKANAALESKVKEGIHHGVDFTAKTTGSKKLAQLSTNKTFNDYVEVGASDIYVSAIAAVLVKMTNGAHGIFSSKHKKRTKPLDKMEQTQVTDEMVETMNNKSDESVNSRTVQNFTERHKANSHENYAAMVDQSKLSAQSDRLQTI